MTTENISDIDTVIRDYPWLADIYEENANYLHKPEEVCNMFSTILKEMEARLNTLEKQSKTDAF